MIDLKSFTQAIQQIADEKSIPQEKIIETIEMALAAAYKRDYGKRGQLLRVKLDPKTGKVKISQIKIVVDETMIKPDERHQPSGDTQETEEPTNKAAEKQTNPDEQNPTKNIEEQQAEQVKVRFNPERHLMLEEALKIKPDAKPGDEIEFPLEYHEEYGRIAAQTAKQVITQRIREIERETVYEEYSQRQGEVVSGIIQRIEGKNVFIDLGRTVAILPAEEQIPYEHYRIGQRIKALIAAVEKTTKGPSIILSRSHPQFLVKLFEIEVPEIPAETVEIKSIAREAGSRSKIAVASNEPGVDPVGSLVGQKGIRVATVIHELGGEKIDIVQWSEDPEKFIAQSLSPAKVLDVELISEQKRAIVYVSEEELSLAIGKGGQNVRLAAKLTGWKIDVQSSVPEIKPVENEEAAEENKQQDKQPPDDLSPEDQSESPDNKQEQEAN